MVHNYITLDNVTIKPISQTLCDRQQDVRHFARRFNKIHLFITQQGGDIASCQGPPKLPSVTGAGIYPHQEEASRDLWRELVMSPDPWRGGVTPHGLRKDPWP